MNLPPTLVAVCVALGFGYAAFGTVTVLSDAAWGVRLWPLELAVAGLAGWASFRWFGRLQSGQARSPRPDRGER